MTMRSAPTKQQKAEGFLKQVFAFHESPTPDHLLEPLLRAISDDAVPHARHLAEIRADTTLNTREITRLCTDLAAQLSTDTNLITTIDSWELLGPSPEHAANAQRLKERFRTRQATSSAPSQR